MEIWKIITNYENYEISNLGNVKNKKTGRILKPWLAGPGYYMVWLGAGNKKYIHRLVALTFIDNINNFNQVDHIDRNKINNNIENLRWVTAQQNIWNQEHKNINKRIIKSIGSNGNNYFSEHYFVNYSISINNNITKCLKYEKNAIEYLEVLKKLYPRNI